MSSFFRARTIRILLQSLSATVLAASQPSCDGSMWIRNGHFADDGIGGRAATSASGLQAARPSRISSARPVVNEAWRLLRFRARLILRLDGEHPYRGLGHHNRQLKKAVTHAAENPGHLSSFRKCRSNQREQPIGMPHRSNSVTQALPTAPGIFP